MSEFMTTLQCGIEQAQRALVDAHLAGQPADAQAHRARLKDLLEVADRTGVDPRAWVDPLILLRLRED